MSMRIISFALTFFHDSVQTANMSLCVLSLPEVIKQTPAGPRIEIPPLLKPLITPETLFLFNKSDLIPPTTTEQILLLSGYPTAWTASLNTGEGTAEFLGGFAKVIQDRYIPSIF